MSDDYSYEILQEQRKIVKLYEDKIVREAGGKLSALCKAYGGHDMQEGGWCARCGYTVSGEASNWNPYR